MKTGLSFYTKGSNNFLNPLFYHNKVLQYKHNHEYNGIFILI